MTCLGSSIIFLLKGVNKNLMDYMLALSAGIMLSASFFSLIIPAINYINYNSIFYVIIFICSFLFGAGFLWLSNTVIDRYINRNNNCSNNFKKCILLFFSITIHNIPEGLVIGIAFGSIYYRTSSLLSAILLTLGIAIQNFPEGAAISLPLKRAGINSLKSFLFGALSGIVEPIAAILGAILVVKIQILLPFIMLFAAGAMIYVVIVELIPDSQNNKKEGLVAFINVIGFSLMMFLELLFR